jgi:hypothetical protein
MLEERKMKAMLAATKRRRIKRGCGICLMPSMRFEMLAGLFVQLGRQEWKERIGSDGKGWERMRKDGKGWERMESVKLGIGARVCRVVR